MKLLTFLSVLFLSQISFGKFIEVNEPLTDPVLIERTCKVMATELASEEDVQFIEDCKKSPLTITDKALSDTAAYEYPVGTLTSQWITGEQENYPCSVEYKKAFKRAVVNPSGNLVEVKESWEVTGVYCE